MRGGNVDYYQVLGVDEKATIAEIKLRYRQLSKTYHPDTPGGDERIMSRINEAYAVLSDPVKRHFYTPPTNQAVEDNTIWREPRESSSQTNSKKQRAYSSRVETEQTNGWAIFFAYVLAIPIAIVLVTILTPIANRYFTRATNNAVVQPGNVNPTPTIDIQPRPANGSTIEQTPKQHNVTNYR
jgi:curved DNA-binding protein CbpA